MNDRTAPGNSMLAPCARGCWGKRAEMSAGANVGSVCAGVLVPLL